jgi:hypothetical protein
VPTLRYIAVVAVLGTVAVLGVANASARRKPTVSHGVPVCTSLPKDGIASALSSFPLRLQHELAGECDYGGRHANRYDDVVAIKPSIGISFVYQAAQQEAKRYWKGTVATLATRGYPWSKGFFATATVDGQGPCKPHHVMSAGGPQCSLDPPQVKFEVVVLGHYRPTHSPMMLAITEIAEQGEAHLSRVVSLAKQIMLGKI